jgi:hypothetical protein
VSAEPQVQNNNQIAKNILSSYTDTIQEKNPIIYQSQNSINKNTNNQILKEYGIINSTRKRNKRKNINTHYNVINFLDRQMLNEFLMRFKDQTIANDIKQERIQNRYKPIFSDIKSRVDTKNKNYGTSLYINYYDKNNKQVFHASFHLCPKFYNPNSNGPIHFRINVAKSKNKTRKSLPAKVCRRSNSVESLYFCLGDTTNKNIDKLYEKEIKIINNVLNSYFTKGRINYLGIGQRSNYPNIDTIYEEMKASRCILDTIKNDNPTQE